MYECKKNMVSIIVPVYNVEKYLDRCVQSLLNQTYKNIEIILVDDGSPDSCPTMCDLYARKYSNVKVIHKKNGGLSSARNIGIKNVLGEYVAFLDSDDWISLNMIEYMVGLMIKYSSDFVQVDRIETYEEHIKISQPKEKIKFLYNKDILEHYLKTSTRDGSYSVCKCLFKADILFNYTFREGKINEDIDFKYKYLMKCQVAIISNQIMYYYYQDSSSITRGGLTAKDFDLYEAADLLYELTSQETYGNIAKLGEIKRARTAFSLLSKIAYYGIKDNNLDKNQVINDLIKEHKRNVFVLLKSPIPLSRKVLCMLYAINFPMSVKLIRIVAKIREHK